MHWLLSILSFLCYIFILIIYNIYFIIYILTLKKKNNNCLKSCPDYSKIDNIDVNDITTCKPCDSTCKTCSGYSATECLSCDIANYLAETNECKSKCPITNQIWHDALQYCEDFTTMKVKQLINPTVYQIQLST